MIKGLSIQKRLELWGEWERHGRNYTAHLQPKSCLEHSGVLVLKDDRPPLPELSDDDAAWFCAIMANVKTCSPYNYRVLKLRYMNDFSIVRVKTFLKVGQDRCYELISIAEFYVEQLIMDGKQPLALQVRQC